MTTEALTTEPGYTLGYVVPKEAFYANVVREEAVSIGKYADGGGCAWEFQITDHPRIGIQLEMFDDAFDAFREIPSFFAALRERPRDLYSLRELLDSLGFVDLTQRKDPHSIVRCACGCDARHCKEAP